MRLIAFGMLLLVLQNATPIAGKVRRPEQQQTNASNHTAYNDQRGTEQSPLVVKHFHPQRPPKKPTEIPMSARQRRRRIGGMLGFLAFWQPLPFCNCWFMDTKPRN